MKKMFIFGLCLLVKLTGISQSIGIGTTTPNSKAQLDISSTSKGLLIPSMTTSQRFGISTPPSGLLVYDIDKNEFYHYNGSGWTPIVNGTYWNRPITSRSRISTSDSVGIGTVGPTQRLDVNGNIRSRDNISADGSLSGASLSVSGPATVASNMLVSGDMTSGGSLVSLEDIVANNANATLQLKTANVNKGYFQLSGDDVRMGTNSGNSTGLLKIRMNGTDRISVDAAGTLDIPGKITTSSSGSKNMLPICYGFYHPSFGIRGSSNFSVVRADVGLYNIFCNRITSNTVVIVNASALNTRAVYFSQTNSGGPYIQIYVVNEDGQPINAGVDFVMFEG